MKKDRGIFLTIILLLPLLGILVGIPGLFDPDRMKQSAGLGNWYPVFIYFNVFLTPFLVWKMWMWKKWAVYVTFISSIVGSWISFIVQQHIQIQYNIFSPFSLISTIFTLILSKGLWLWAVYRKWRYFE